MPGATQQFTIQTGTFLRVLIITTGTKWGNSGQTAGTYCHPTNGKPSCYECCPCNSPWYLGEQLALNGLCNNLILLSFYLFVNLWNRNKRSRRLKLEGKFEEFFSLSSSHLMLIIILWENLTHTRHSCECFICMILFNLHKKLYCQCHHYHPCFANEELGHREREHLA